MNLARCMLGEGGIDLGGITLPLPERWRGRAGLHTLGLRPEHLHLAPASPADLALPATLQLVEPLGAETLITARIGASDVIARVAAGFHQPPGAALVLHLDPQHLQLFDGSSGQAVGR
jgi:ABC-type sugar transport system ATPase subunit